MLLMLLAAAAAAPSPADQAAIFTAAGFTRHGTEWRTKNCEGMEGASYGPGTLDTFRDLNGDGRPEAVVSESSAICYGMTGTHFWLLSKQASGAWKLVFNETAMPDFLASKGAGGWPDIQLGGPGFCFPVWRWNGRDYALHRFEYEGKACKPPQP
jgi:hypothetical protein